MFGSVVATDIGNWAATKVGAEAVRSSHWSDNLYNYGCYTGHPFDLFVDFGTVNPNYVQTFTADDGRKRRMFPRGGGFVPWPPLSLPCPVNLRPGTGTDRQATVPMANGGYYNYWEISTPNTPGHDNPFDPCSQFGGLSPNAALYSYNMAVDACVGGLEIIPPSEHGNLSTQSPAVPLHIGVVRVGEAATGVIDHKMAMTISRNCGMTGIVAPRGITDVENERIGVTGGFRAACAPARILTPSAPTIAEHTIPEAMSFALHITDDEIEQWLDTRGYTGVLRATAKMFAVAMRDYGVVLVAFGGTAAILTDGDKSWSTLGITKNIDLLAGLVTRARLYALRPPTATYTDGTTGTREGNATLIG